MARYRLPLLCLCLALAACSRLTLANYERIQLGMSYQEVVALLGKADECSDVMLARSCRWGASPRSVTVQFVADKAVVFTAEGLR